MTWQKVGFKGPDVEKMGRKEFHGLEMFRGIQWAVEALANEKPEGVSIDLVHEIVCEVSQISETLFNLRNKLRKAKGLDILPIERCRDGIDDVAGYSDKDRAVLFLAVMSGELKNAPEQVLSLAIIAGWSQATANHALESCIEGGLVKKVVLKAGEARKK